MITCPSFPKLRSPMSGDANDTIVAPHCGCSTWPSYRERLRQHRKNRNSCLVVLGGIVGSFGLGYAHSHDAASMTSKGGFDSACKVLAVPSQCRHDLGAAGLVIPPSGC